MVCLDFIFCEMNGIMLIQFEDIEFESLSFFKKLSHGYIFVCVCV